MSAPDTTSLVDIHNHLVPGVDDGARNTQAVLDSVERMTRRGIRRVVTTPHIQGSLTLDPSRYEDRLAEVTAAFEEAREAVKAAFPEVEFRRGHEVLIDVPTVDVSDPRVRMGGTSFVLIEWPRLQIPPGTVGVIEDIRAQGYRPIVAHPERYVELGKNLRLVGRWRQLGGYLQVNYGSLVGRYGRAAQAVAFKLLRQGWVDYLATDFHGHPTLKLYKDEGWAALEAREALDTADLLGRTNPARLLNDDEPLPAPTLTEDPTFLKRLRYMIKRESG